MRHPLLMGIVNVTPDSFFAPSRHLEIDQAVATALRFQTEGADLIDIGGESSRPGAKAVSEEEELARVIPIIQQLQGKLTIPISIDTTKPAVARAALASGASLLNDIAGFENPGMQAIAKEFDADICVMHMQGNPQTMQVNPHYPNGITAHLLHWFTQKIEALTHAGINPERIILDPGIGFGKTVADNLEIIHNLPEFKGLGFRILLGVSRKSFMGKILNKPSHELLPATIAMNVMAIASQVDIIRVHDVKEHREVIDIMQAYNTHR